MGLMKYPKIKGLHHSDTHGILNGEVYICEKIDGSNGRFRLTDDGFMIGSRTREFTERPGNDKGKENTWVRFWDLMESKKKKVTQWIHPNWILFGELYGKLNHHTIAYPVVDFDFIVFDVFDEAANRFLKPEEWEHPIREAGLSQVEHTRMTLDYDILDHMLDAKDPVKDSFEGFVIKNFDSIHSRIDSKRLYGKIYHPKVKGMTSKIFGRPTDVRLYRTENALLREWVTVQRVVNVLNAGWDEGEKGSGLEVMVWLIKRVWEDVIREEITDYVLSDKFKGTNKRTPTFGEVVTAINKIHEIPDRQDAHEQAEKLADELLKPPKGKVLHLDIGWMKRRLGGIVQLILKEYLLGDAVEAGEKLKASE